MTLTLKDVEPSNQYSAGACLIVIVAVPAPTNLSRFPWIITMFVSLLAILQAPLEVETGN